MLPAELPQAWRTRAAELRRYAAEPQAVALEQAAADLEAALTADGLELLSIADASTESGYTGAHLRRLIREGTLANRGTPAEPRIMRRHLPRKPGFGSAADVAPPEVVEIRSRRQIARAIARGG